MNQNNTTRQRNSIIKQLATTTAITAALRNQTLKFRPKKKPLNTIKPVYGAGLLFLLAACSSKDKTINGTAGDDLLIGGSDDETINGRDGDDIINGGAGNDTLNGGAGDDNLDGGAGNDTASYAGATAAVTVNLSISEAQDTMGAGTDTLSNIENLTGSDFDDTLIGNDNSNTLRGAAGNDILQGGDGGDNLYGDAGDDRLLGGTGEDTLNGGDDHDLLVGYEANDTLFGGDGNDELIGLDGNDNLDGGDGFDFVVGDDGNDTLKGGDGDDFIVGGLDDDTLEGGNGNDFLIGDEGVDVLTGGAGDDLFLIYAVDPNNDTLDGFYAETTTITDFNTGNDRLVFFVNDSVSNYTSLNSLNIRVSIENNDTKVYSTQVTAEPSIDVVVAILQGYTGTFNFADDVFVATLITGTQSDDTLNGTDSNDFIDGFFGDDILNGGEGNDDLYGDFGDDRLDGGNGNNVLAGGFGDDEFVIYQSSQFYSGVTTIKDFKVGGDKLVFNVSDSSSNYSSLASFNARSEIDDGNMNIYDTKGTVNTSDDMLVVILEDYTTALNFDDDVLVQII